MSPKKINNIFIQKKTSYIQIEILLRFENILRVERYQKQKKLGSFFHLNTTCLLHTVFELIWY